ncbi:MAG: PIN domain-containing protein [Pseudomonadota bacterium]
MKGIFIDTGFIIALESVTDQNHEKALQLWNELLKDLPKMVTTTYVIDEIVTFFNNRNRHAKAVEIGNRLMNSRSIRVLHVDKGLFCRSWQYFQQHDDKTYSLTDCISFIVMTEEASEAALSFDKHFIQAGFKVLPLLERRE